MIDKTKKHSSKRPSAQDVPRWQTRTSPQGGFSFDMKKAKFKAVDSRVTTLVEYRPWGSKGRWSRVVVIGKVPKDIQLFCTTYDAQVKAERGARRPRRTGSSAAGVGGGTAAPPKYRCGPAQKGQYVG